MKCGNCKNGTMNKSFVNTVREAGYSVIYKRTCNECDFTYMEVG